MLKNWLKIYWYNTMKHKMYFLLTVVGLAIGIASVVLASLYYLEESSYDKWNPNKDEVYVVENVGESMQYNAQPLPLGRYIKDNSDAVEDYMYYSYYQSADIAYQDKIFKTEKIFDVQNNFFLFFPYDFIYGNAQTALVNENDAAIDLSVSNKMFGKDINPIGKQIEFNDRVYVVSGVFDLNDKRSSLMPLVVTNMLTKEVLINSDWGLASYPVLVKTKDTKRVGELITKVIDDNYYAATAKELGVSLKEMKATTLKELITKPKFYVLNGIKMQSDKSFFGEPSTNMRLLIIVTFLSVSILLLSIFNYVNLSLTQIMERGKEVGVRKVLGAKSREIYKQNILESFIIVLFSFVIGICCIEVILPYINVFFNTNIEVSFIKHFVVLVAILTITVVLCGIIPASYISKYNVVYVLKGRISRGAKGKPLRSFLLVLQFVIACFFIVCSLIINKQVNHMLDKDLGFKGSQVMTVPFLESTKYDSIRFDKYQNFKIEISKIKGVEDVTTSGLSFGLYGGRTVFSFFEYGGKKSLTQRVIQDYSFVDVMQIKLKEGRMLSEKFATDSISNVLVNESFVNQFELKNPINTEIVSNKLKFNQKNSSRLCLGVHW